MTIKVDRFDALVNAIHKTVNRERMQTISERTVWDWRDTAVHNLRLFSPYKTRETHMTTGHRHLMIADSWVPQPVQRTRDGATVLIINESEHVGWQRTGRPAHKIPMRGPHMLKFWMGKPLKWGVGDPSRKKRPGSRRIRHAGFYRFREVDHPGFGPWGGRDFVEVAADAMRTTSRLRGRGCAKLIAFRPLLELFCE